MSSTVETWEKYWNCNGTGKVWGDQRPDDTWENEPCTVCGGQDGWPYILHGYADIAKEIAPSAKFP